VTQVRSHRVQRCTVAFAAEVKGMGLFSARPAMVRVLPAEAGAGLRFRRVDLPGSPVIKAHISSLAKQPEGVPARNTTLAASGGGGAASAIVMTTEHVLSALFGIGITDAIIEIDGPEVPIADGSALPFAQEIAPEPIGEINPLIPLEPVVVRSGEATIVATPRARPGCSFTYHLDYGAGAPISKQSATFARGTEAHMDSRDDPYFTQVAPARTFCLESEARAMRDSGLFKHLSERDMLVIGPKGPIDNTLRFENEPARHKLLDLIGDLAIVGRPIQADIVATRSGHALNHEIARALLEETNE
jgi:UDP-3-O-acyl-N-acetylglucosamine deacetylase